MAAEGMYTGQSVYCGKKAEVGIGNVLPLRGDYATVIGHSDDKTSTFLRLPSGIKKTVPSR